MQHWFKYMQRVASFHTRFPCNPFIPFSSPQPQTIITHVFLGRASAHMQWRATSNTILRKRKQACKNSHPDSWCPNSDTHQLLMEGWHHCDSMQRFEMSFQSVRSHENLPAMYTPIRPANAALSPQVVSQDRKERREVQSTLFSNSASQLFARPSKAQNEPSWDHG